MSAVYLTPGVRWAQRRNLIFLSIDVTDADDVIADMKPTSLNFECNTKQSNKKYQVKLEFMKEIDPEKSRYAVRPRYIQMILSKQKEGPYWERLLASKGKVPWLKVDFEKWKDDESEEAQPAKVEKISNNSVKNVTATPVRQNEGQTEDITEKKCTDNEMKAELFKIVEILGRGKGIVATQDIKRGTIVYVETPLFTTRFNNGLYSIMDINTKISGLTKDQYAQFMDLYDPEPTSEPLLKNIRLLNANSIGEDGGCSVCAVLSRLNHSCLPNSLWLRKDNQYHLSAIRDIVSGEEILINYIPAFLTKSEREAQLLDEKSFQCDCSICSLDAAASAANDVMRMRVRDDHRTIEEFFTEVNRHSNVKYIRKHLARIVQLTFACIDIAENKLKEQAGLFVSEYNMYYKLHCFSSLGKTLKIKLPNIKSPEYYLDRQREVCSYFGQSFNELNKPCSFSVK